MIPFVSCISKYLLIYKAAFGLSELPFRATGAATIAVQNTATYFQQAQILNRPVAPADAPQGIDLELACAIVTRLAHQPELIFLERAMPYTNRYEICTLLRKLACFHDIPIVILTSNDGLVERVKARLVKVSDFLSNPSMLVSC